MTDHDRDREILDLLAAGLAATEPIPESATRAAKAVLTWRTIDAELMEIGFDSAVDEAVGVRSSGMAAVRAVRFSAGEIEVEVQIEEGSIDGQVVAPGPAAIRLERTDGTVLATAADELGRFEYEGIASGPLRFRVEVGDDVLVTQWFVI